LKIKKLMLAERVGFVLGMTSDAFTISLA